MMSRAKKVLSCIWTPVRSETLADYAAIINSLSVFVALCVGCSLSWLPAGLTSRIRKDIFVNPNNTQLETLQGKESQFNKPNLQTYTIYVNPDVWRVKLKFRGIGDSSVVEVLAPIDPFASTMDDPNAAEGGVRMHRGMLHIAPEKHYFLGLVSSVTLADFPSSLC